MQLKKGIKIYSPNKKNTDFVKITDGVLPYYTQTPTKVSFNFLEFEAKYEKNAFLAKREWFDLKKEDILKIKTNFFNKDYNTIFLEAIPVKLQFLFNKLQLHTAISETEIFNIFRQNEEIVSEINSELNQFLDKYSQKDYTFLSLTTNYPNCESVSLDKSKINSNFHPSEFKFIGLHKDSSNKEMTIHTSHKFGNRLTINLGKESRFLIFINLSIIQIYNMLKTKIDVKKEKISNRNITNFFFK